METLSLIFITLTAFLHMYFYLLEMFFWTKPLGLKVFHMKEEVANLSKVLAANQGVYNLVLALGLLISLFLPDSTSSLAIQRYILSFIIIVGSYGSYSLKSVKIFLIQVLPAILALLFNELAYR